MTDKTKNNGAYFILIVLILVGAFVGAGWALDSRIDHRIDREIKPIITEVKRIREVENTLARIEERLKSIEQNSKR